MTSGGLYAEVRRVFQTPPTFDRAGSSSSACTVVERELRFQVLGRIRNLSLQRALERDCDFYFVCDVDNFIRPATLRELVALNLPIAFRAACCGSLEPGRFYSNYHAEVGSDHGYYRNCDQCICGSSINGSQAWSRFRWFTPPI